MQIGVGYECIPFLRGNLGLIGALGSPTTLSTQGLSERGPNHHPESQLRLLANGCCTKERMIEPQPTCFPNSACLGLRQHIFLRVLECTAWDGCVFLRSYKGLQDFSAFRVPTFQHSWVLFHIFKFRRFHWSAHLRFKVSRFQSHMFRRAVRLEGFRAEPQGLFV